MSQFPSIGDYNHTIQKKGGAAFRTMRGINIIPARTVPIKVFLFGSGAYAAVFKGYYSEKTYALRCFLTAEQETIERYKIICRYLQNINSSWITPCEFLEHEIEVKGERYPVLKMEWVNGILINNFISRHLSSVNAINAMQEKLVALSTDLERNQIGHGDLQSGNIIVTGSVDNFNLRLIDYDGLFVPGLNGQSATERGRSEFQHPKRTLNHFSSEIDRFSFWVMLTALEALKFDKSLWDEVMQGGFNTLDNFLFTIQDFTNPHQSKLFSRLWSLNAPSLDFYLTKLMGFCIGEITAVEKPHLLDSSPESPEHVAQQVDSDTAINPKNKKRKDTSNFRITANTAATVLTSSFKKLGTTPLELDKQKFSRKIIIVTTGTEIQQIELRPSLNSITVSFQKDKGKEYPISTRETLTGDSSPVRNTTQESNQRPVDGRASEIDEALAKARKKRKEREKLKEQEEREAREKQERVDRKLQENQWKEKAERIAKEKMAEKARKATKEQKIINWTLIIFVLAIVSMLIIKKTNPSFASNSTTTVINHQEIIQNFLSAEQQRNFPLIKTFFASSIARYYNETNPSLSDIEKIYRHSWQLISQSKNEVQRIEERPGNQYDLHTTYSYYDDNKATEFQINSVVRFEFNDEGKIIRTYNLKSDEPVPTYLINREPITTTPRETIKLLLEAEERRDFDEVYNYFSSPMKQYWHLTNPSYRELKHLYNSDWNITSSSRNEVLTIKRIQSNKYDLHTKFSYFHNSQKKQYSIQSVVRFEFDQEGRILKVKGVEQGDNTFENNEYVASNMRVEESTYYGDYLYKTSFIKNYKSIVPIRRRASINAPLLFEAPKNSTVYVLQRTTQGYYSVYVNGKHGFVSKALLKRQ